MTISWRARRAQAALTLGEDGKMYITQGQEADKVLAALTILKSAVAGPKMVQTSESIKDFGFPQGRNPGMARLGSPQVVTVSAGNSKYSNYSALLAPTTTHTPYLKGYKI